MPSILGDLRELLEKRASHPNHVELLGADDMLKEAIQEMGGFSTTEETVKILVPTGAPAATKWFESIGIEVE